MRIKMYRNTGAAKGEPRTTWKYARLANGGNVVRLAWVGPLFVSIATGPR